MKRPDLLACGLLALVASVLIPGASFAQGKYPERPVRS